MVNPLIYFKVPKTKESESYYLKMHSLPTVLRFMAISLKMLSKIPLLLNCNTGMEKCKMFIIRVSNVDLK